MSLRAILIAAGLAQATPAFAPAATLLPPSGAPASRLPNAIRYLSGEDRKPQSFAFVGNLIFFKARLANREVWMLLDNRATRSLIDAELATSLGLRVETRKGQTIRTPTGTLPYRMAMDVPLLVPGQMETKLSMASVDLRRLSGIIRHPIDAVFGADLIGRSILNIDPENMTLQFARAGARMPMPVAAITLASSRPQMDIRINGKPVRLTIDLGFNGALALTPEAWARVGLTDVQMRKGFTVHAEGQAYAHDRGVLPQIEIGGVSHSNVSVAVRAVLPGDGDGMIGMALIGRFVTLLDTRGAKIWLAPRQAPATTVPVSALQP
jgi:predicted aspartyl protease